MTLSREYINDPFFQSINYSVSRKVSKMTVAEKVTKQRTRPASQHVQQCNACNQFDHLTAYERIFCYWDFFATKPRVVLRPSCPIDALQSARDTDVRPVQKCEPSSSCLRSRHAVSRVTLSLQSEWRLWIFPNRAPPYAVVSEPTAQGMRGGSGMCNNIHSFCKNSPILRIQYKIGYFRISPQQNETEIAWYAFMGSWIISRTWRQSPFLNMTLNLSDAMPAIFIHIYFI
jgi:hypothetical protein